MVSLIFKGCSGYKKSFGGHKVGKVMEYVEDKANKLMRDMPDAFEVVRACKEDTPRRELKKETKKDVPVFDNKMIVEPEEKKEKKFRRITKRGK